MAKHHTLLRKEFNDNENERTRTTKDHKHDEVFTDDIPYDSPLAKWRRQVQEWEQNAVKKSEDKFSKVLRCRHLGMCSESSSNDLLTGDSRDLGVDS
jgi:hypothetical protein